MSGHEMAIRLVRELRNAQWRKRECWIAGNAQVEPRDAWSLPRLNPELARERGLLIDEAERYLGGEYRFLNVTFPGSELDWHFDPETGTHSPLSFALDIDYRR